jgi:predicted ATP-grasp superfamily ATP-dependent carboligase
LFKEIGYFGVFEAEFIHCRKTDQYLLMDLNPRYYSQMAFEIAQGYPLPLLILLAANDEVTTLKTTVFKIKTQSNNKRKYRHWFIFNLLLICQRISLRMSKDERDRWLRWQKEDPDEIVDAIYQPGDNIPTVLDTLFHLRHFLRHPRDFLKKYFIEN